MAANLHPVVQFHYRCRTPDPEFLSINETILKIKFVQILIYGLWVVHCTDYWYGYNPACFYRSKPSRISRDACIDSSIQTYLFLLIFIENEPLTTTVLFVLSRAVYRRCDRFLHNHDDRHVCIRSVSCMNDNQAWSSFDGFQWLIWLNFYCGLVTSYGDIDLGQHLPELYHHCTCKCPSI